MLESTVCRFEDFQSDWYGRVASGLDLDDASLPAEHPRRNIHRKVWEFCAIVQALDDRDMLREGRSGVGFAVGREPLPSFFAARGAEILGTDLPPGQSDPAWIETNQHAASLEALRHPNLVEAAQFDRLVSFRAADMRALEGFESDRFDFLWSSCAFEHLGSLQAGLDFVLDAMALLKPGGIAVHTTEYNVSSNNATLETGNAVIYRRRDIEALGEKLRSRGSLLSAVDFDSGSHPYDLDYDIPPYYQAGKKHVKLKIGGFVATSILLVIRRES